MSATSPPGPRGLPLLGSALDFRRDPLGFFSETARRYGDVAAFRLGRLQCCLVSRPDLIGEVLEDHDGSMLKPWDERQLRVALGDGLLTGSGERWRRQRKLVEPAFRGERLLGYAGVMARCALEATRGWRAGEVLDVHAEMQRITLVIVGETLLGAELLPRASEAVGAFEVLTNRFERMLTGRLPIPLTARTPGNVRLHRAVRQLHAIAGGIVAARRAGRQRGNGDADLLGMLLHVRDEEGGQLDDRELREIVVTLIAAGHETTALALAWSLHLLGLHPEVDARLAQEARNILGSPLPEKTGGPPVTDPTSASLADPDAVRKLPYARQVVREALRLYPPAWGIGREATREIDLGGYAIPTGTQVFLIPWVTHHDPRWFPQPERFDPDRWAERAPPIRAHAWLPFGGGPRGCLGSGFAMIEAPLVLAELVRRWRFVPLPNHPIELQPAITLRPRFGIRMKLEPRGG